MSDITGLGVTDWGSLLNSFGQGQQQQRLTGYEADRAAAQTQGMQQQNTMAQAAMPYIMQQMQQLQQQDQQGQQNAASDSSGGQSGASGAATTPGGFPAGQDPNAALTQAENDAIDRQHAALPPAAGGVPVPAATKSGVAPTPVDDSSGLDAGYIGRLDQGLHKALAVNDAGTPQEQQAVTNAMRRAGTLNGIAGFIPAAGGVAGDALGALEQAKAQRDLGIQQRHANSTLQAASIFDRMRSVVEAGENGNALHTLDAIDPNVAARIKSKVKDPVEQEADAMAYATHVAGEVHMYTKRPIAHLPDGTPIDAETGIPVPGAGRSGLSMEQRVQMYKSLLEPKTITDGKGGSWTQSMYAAPLKFGGLGATTIEAGVARMLALGGSPLGSTQVRGSAPFKHETKIAGQVQDQARADAPPNSAARSPTGTAPMSNRSQYPTPPVGTFAEDINRPRPIDPQGIPAEYLGTPLPGAKDADVWPVFLRDRYTHAHNTPGAQGGDPDNQGNGPNTTMNGTQLANQARYNQAVPELKQWGEQATASAQQAITNFTLARDILTGKYDNQPLSALGTGLPGAFTQWAAQNGIQNITGEKRAEAAKYLAMGAETQMASGGAPKSATALEFNANKATPNLDKMDTKSAVDLLNTSIEQANYTNLAAGRIPAAMQFGVDPDNYGKNYAHYFPRSAAISAAAHPPMVRMISPDGIGGPVAASRQKAAEKAGFKLAPAVAQ